VSYSPNRPDMSYQGAKIENYSDRDGQAVYAIVQHVMGRVESGELATMAGTKSWFENPKSKVSAHFGIGLDGTTWQFVSLAKAAWANGILENPDRSIKWLDDCVKQNINPNTRTISIEHQGDGVMPMPEAQYRASLALNRWLVSLNGLRPGTQTIIRHSQITGKQRANCPGISFPINRTLKDLGAFRNKSNTFIDAVTGIMVNEEVTTVYKANGGLAIFGRPITDVESGAGMIPPCEFQQWFERARFEKRGNRIDLGLVGSEAHRYAI